MNIGTPPRLRPIMVLLGLVVLGAALSPSAAQASAGDALYKGLPPCTAGIPESATVVLMPAPLSVAVPVPFAPESSAAAAPDGWFSCAWKIAKAVSLCAGFFADVAIPDQVPFVDEAALVLACVDATIDAVKECS